MPKMNIVDHHVYIKFFLMANWFSNSENFILVNLE